MTRKKIYFYKEKVIWKENKVENKSLWKINNWSSKRRRKIKEESEVKCFVVEEKSDSQDEYENSDEAHSNWITFVNWFLRKSSGKFLYLERQISALKILNNFLTNQRLVEKKIITKRQKIIKNSWDFWIIYRTKQSRKAFSGAKWQDEAKLSFYSLLLLPFYSCLPFSVSETMLLWGNWKRK